MHLQQMSKIAWSCPHRMYLRADLAYEVTQERGYCVTRLLSVKFLEAPLLPHVRPTPRKGRGNVIPFPKPGHSTRELREEYDIQRGFAQLAQHKPDSCKLQGQGAERSQDPHETVAWPTLDEVLAALSRENEKSMYLRHR